MLKKILLTTLAMVAMSASAQNKDCFAYVTIKQNDVAVSAYDPGVFHLTGVNTNLEMHLKFVDGKAVASTVNAGATTEGEAVAVLPIDNNNGSMLMDFNSSSDGKISVTVPSNFSHCTYYTPFKIIVDDYDGDYNIFTAQYSNGYIVTGNGSTAVTGVIPAGTPMIIRKGDTGTVTFYTTADEASANVSGNVLSGTALTIPTSDITGGTVCTFGHSSSDKTQLGFFKYSGTNLNAGKAYYVATGSSNAKGFLLVDETSVSGINQIENDAVNNENSAAYNLAGQRVNANSKGIVIISGKKYINK